MLKAAKPYFFLLQLIELIFLFSLLVLNLGFGEVLGFWYEDPAIFWVFRLLALGFEEHTFRGFGMALGYKNPAFP